MIGLVLWVLFSLLIVDRISTQTVDNTFFEIQPLLDGTYNDVCECDDGSFGLTGFFNGSFFISRFDEQVKHHWTKLLLLESFQLPIGRISCACCSDNGDDNDLIVSGSFENSATNNTLFYIHFNKNGNSTWNRTMSINYVENSFMTYCVTSKYFIFASINKTDLIMLRGTLSGTLVSSEIVYGISDHTYSPEMTTMKSDGGFLLAGRGSYAGSSGFVLNFNSEGGLIWGKLYYFTDVVVLDEHVFGACELEDGGILGAGYYFRTGSLEHRAVLNKWTGGGSPVFSYVKTSTNRVEWFYRCANIPGGDGKYLIVGSDQNEARGQLILFPGSTDKTFLWRKQKMGYDFRNSRGLFLSFKQTGGIYVLSTSGHLMKLSPSQVLEGPSDSLEAPALCPASPPWDNGYLTTYGGSSGIMTTSAIFTRDNFNFVWSNYSFIIDDISDRNNNETTFCWSCMGNSSVYFPYDNKTECSNQGICKKDFRCECDMYIGGDACDRPSDCKGSINAEQCNGHGDCIYDSICNCTKNYTGDLCELFLCFGLNSSDDNNTCTGMGDCVDVNQCNCSYGWKGEHCSKFTCFGYLGDDNVNTCSGHGNCTEVDDCDCYANYTGKDCSSWHCFGVEKSANVYEVCSGHGQCISPDNCSCGSDNYLGDKCHLWKCYDIPNSNLIGVCSGHGVCAEIDTCLCVDGYTSSQGKYGPCEIWTCNGVNKHSSGVCNSRGTCIGNNLCSCTNGFEGIDCETWSCGAVDHRYADVCKGKGKCVNPGKCDCNTGYAGKNCETNQLYSTVMAPILSLFSASVLLCFFSILSCACCTIVTCCCGLSILGVVVCCCCCIVGIQKKRMIKFDQLKDFDLLLAEQKMEEDGSVAHLRINKKLFEIPFNEIKTTRILGTGGSLSVVFEALWRSEVVAFKCFKTRQLMGSQNDFDEFEIEVQILSSLNHPNIIRFFGATMKPPRVGIVMEFCSNGEIMEFFDRHEKTKGIQYPVNETIRLCSEIVAALTYCHSRNIIHRDLKCENVLIDSKERAKLMDFGLSRVVDNMTTSQKMTKSVGTNIYMSPEVVTEDSYDTQCDVFSFAILFFVLITKNPMPYGDKPFRVEFKVASDRNFRPDLGELDRILKNEKSLKWVKYIIKRCWDHTPKYRLKMSQVEDLFREHLDMVDHTKTVHDMRRMSVLLQQENSVAGLKELQDQIVRHEAGGGSESPDGLLNDLNTVEGLRKELEVVNNELDDTRMENISFQEQLDNTRNVNKRLLEEIELLKNGGGSKGEVEEKSDVVEQEFDEEFVDSRVIFRKKMEEMKKKRKEDDFDDF